MSCSRGQSPACFLQKSSDSQQSKKNNTYCTKYLKIRDQIGVYLLTYLVILIFESSVQQFILQIHSSYFDSKIDPLIVRGGILVHLLATNFNKKLDMY